MPPSWSDGSSLRGDGGVRRVTGVQPAPPPPPSCGGRPPLPVFWRFVPLDVLGTLARYSISVRCLNSSATHLRMSTTSLTVAVFVPRSSSISSINLGKLSSVSSLKMKSTKSTRPTTSTPTSWMIFAASGFTRICSNSWREMCWLSSPSMPLFSSMESSLFFTKVTCSCSFSTADTTLTTSTSTPTSMFMTVRDTRRMKTMMRTAKPACSWPTPSTSSAMSGSVPRSSSVLMDLPTLLKYVSPIFVPVASCLKAMAKT
mmetsp:Transcript_67898/g.219442  ORF Transcript_67898/g.219442 Transcript_67898/m.219442 type:complete len:258 (-) Transcript_67898:1020-1793(-)